MYSRSALFYVLVLTVLTSTFAQDACNIEGISDTEFIYGHTNPDTINDTFIGTVEEFNGTDIQEARIEDARYIDVRVENNVLTIFTTPEFLNYEDQEESATVTVNIHFICVNGNNTLEYKLKILDENNHDPIFDQEHYYYTIYDKFPDSFEVSLTDLKPIKAIDVDISNSRVEFSIETNDFLKISYLARSTANGKEFLATLDNTKELLAPFNETYEITATDSGSPTRTSTALLTVDVISISNPIFTESMYIAHITEDLDIIVDNGPITFTEELDDVTIVLPQEYADYFQVSVTDEIKLAATGTNVTDLLRGNNYIILFLNAKNSTSETIGKTSVIIDMSALTGMLLETTEYFSTDETTLETHEDSSGSDEISLGTEEDETSFENDESTLEINTSTLEYDISSTEDPDSTTRNETESSTQSVYIELSGFNYWVSFSMALNIVIFILSAIVILCAIIYMKSKLCR